jgi:hypothetical protein
MNDKLIKFSPIVVVTAFDDSLEKKKLLDIGAD